MTTLPLTRVNYYDRQHLRLAEFTDEQAYHIAQRRRHNLSHHGWGIVTGLELVRQDDGQPAVRPGLAIDGYGRELLFTDRAVFGRDAFDRLGTSRIDLWLEYRLDVQTDPAGSARCDPAQMRAGYRATERAEIVARAAAGAPQPLRPPGVPSSALEAPLLDTPDDPARPWPVYLGRLAIDLSQPATPAFTLDASNRVYIGLMAELIDHPGSAARLELGRARASHDLRTIGTETIDYKGDAARQFAVFVPSQSGGPLDPTLEITSVATTIRGTTEVHGDVIVDGATVVFPDAPAGPEPNTQGQPALYRIQGPNGDELRIDVGSVDDAGRSLTIGYTQNGAFQAAVEILFAVNASGIVVPTVVIRGDLRVDGAIEATDVRTRTVTPDVAAVLNGIVQAVLTSA